MKARPDCIVCMFRQALNTARLVSDDPGVHLAILQGVAARVSGLSLDRTPANLSQPCYEVVSAVTGVADPYEEQKRESNRMVLELLPEIRAAVAGSADPLDAAIHAAAAGNIIDLGIGHEFDIRKDALAMLKQGFAVNAVEEFRAELRPGRKLLYLGDNAGEIVFDTLLVEMLTGYGVDLTYTVKSGPIINDATMQDARDVGMTGLARVIETGSADIGVGWRNVSDEFRTAFETADIILAKGHGNFETCNDRSENIYFLLKAKCTMVAQELCVTLGDIVFKHSSGRPRTTDHGRQTGR